jgi:hypothetical protein
MVDSEETMEEVSDRDLKILHQDRRAVGIAVAVLEAV